MAGLWPLRGIQDRVGDAGDSDHFGDIVDAHDVRATENRCGHGGGGAEQTLLGRRARAARARKRLAKKRFPRSADHDRAAEARELGKPRENFEILFVLFSKSDSRIEQELRFCEARAPCARHCLAQARSSRRG